MKRLWAVLLIGFLLSSFLSASVLAVTGEPVRLVVDGREVFCDLPPQMILNRVFVPIRFVAENLRADVEWSQTEGAVYIKTDPLLKIVAEFPELQKRAELRQKPLKISGPDSFRQKILETLDLLGPQGRAMVEDYISEITLSTPEEYSAHRDSLCYLDTLTNTVHFNPDCAERIDRITSGWPEETKKAIWVSAVVHETAHAQTLCLYTWLNEQDGELLANLAAYRAMERLGTCREFLHAWKRANLSPFVPAD